MQLIGLNSENMLEMFTVFKIIIFVFAMSAAIKKDKKFILNVRYKYNAVVLSKDFRIYQVYFGCQILIRFVKV